MEYAKSDKLLAALSESDTTRPNARHQLVPPLHPLYLRFVDQHPKIFSFRRFSKKLSRGKFKKAAIDNSTGE